MKSVMLIAGETSGDTLGAELVRALRPKLNQGTNFIGAGGSKMREAGVDIAIDMTEHAVIGLGDVLRNYGKFKRIFRDLLNLAVKHKPELIVLVDFSGFNRRFAKAVREEIRRNPWLNWNPKIVQYVSPQVWASRPSRAEKMAQDVDLLLCLFPFEKTWYAKRTPEFRVECIGHSIFDRYASFERANTLSEAKPSVVILPGSRRAELKRHLPVMLAAAARIAGSVEASFKLVLPTEDLRPLLDSFAPDKTIQVQIGGLADALSTATIAIASTGTVLLECAYFGVPTVAMYRTSWGTYQIGKRIIQVKYLSMPNILADEVVFPEFVQDDATPENVSKAALHLLTNESERTRIKSKLQQILTTLGGPGASERAATAIQRLVN